jgi:murein DD-endopeptidase MepM/ murein hydrolase activator NlpD
MQNLLIIIDKMWRLKCMRAVVFSAAYIFSPRAVLAQAPWMPVQVEMRVPFEPTAFPSEQRTYLFYEIYLTNFQNDPVYLSRIEVLDADAPAAPPIAAFAAEQFPAIMEARGAKAPPDSKGDYQIVAGGTAIAFVSIVLDQGSHFPPRLLQRVRTTGSVIEGAVISTHHTTVHVLGPPVEGANWLAHEGPSNDNHHRRGMTVVNGNAVITGRYAIDWNKVEGSGDVSGDPHDVHSYPSYGKPVFAVAEGRVVTARDGFPDNDPGQDNNDFKPAVPTTLETQPGNTVVIDLGGGQFARYMHLQPGSVRVKAGDRVRRGQLIAHTGNSGDARGPHLHFEVTTSAKPGGEGVPYVIDSYRGTSANGKPIGVRKHELPLKNTLVDFPGG